MPRLFYSLRRARAGDGLRGILAAAAIAFAGWACAADDGLARTLARVREAYGIQAQPGSIQLLGRTSSLARGEGEMERLWRAPDRFRVTLRYSGGTEERILDGRQAWQGGRPMGPPFRQAMLLQAARTALPWMLLDPASKIDRIGDATDDQGRHVDLLRLELEPPLAILIEIDSGSGHVLRATGTGVAGLSLATAYSEFVRHDGQFFARREDHYAMGRYIGFSTVERLVVGAPPPASSQPPPRR